MTDEREYEVLREVFFITEWKDGTVYKTVSQGIGWFDKSLVDSNRPAETGLVYAPLSNKDLPYEGSYVQIRRKRHD